MFTITPPAEVIGSQDIAQRLGRLRLFLARRTTFTDEQRLRIAEAEVETILFLFQKSEAST